MDTNSFWSLIDKSLAASAGEPEQQLEEVGALLEQLSTDEIIEFEGLFSENFFSSYSWSLWGAAYVIGGGCSDDSFDYFRGWLISRGRKVFDAAVANPDELASLITDEDEEVDCQIEGWQSVAVLAWCRKTKKEYSAFPFKKGRTYADGPAGEEWAEEDLDRLYPKLSARFN
jgi:Protein of unknown function (DUF4240)